MATTYVALGSNMGNRQQHLRSAIVALNAFQNSRVSEISGIYETPPTGSQHPQPMYYNAVVKMHTLLPPTALLHHMFAVERRAGRLPPSSRASWSARTLDLDLLLYDDRVIDENDLVVPHPRMTERWFVLKPLCDVNPDVVHPTTGKTAIELLEELSVTHHSQGHELALDFEPCLIQQY